MVSSYDLYAGGKVPWQDISRHANSKACKPWIQVVSDYDKDKYEYNWDGDFLASEYLDNKVHFDVSDLCPGDLIRVSGASHSNDKTLHARVTEVDLENGTLEIERVSEREMIATLQADDTDKVEQMRNDAIQTLREINDRDTIRYVQDVLQEEAD